MTEFEKQELFANQFPDETAKSSPSFWKWGVSAFVVMFLFTLLFTNAFYQRKFLISEIQKQMVYSIQSLNRFGWDLAYNEISFNAFPLLSLGEIKQVKLYNRYAHTSWNCEKISFDNSILDTQKLQIELEGKQFLSLNGNVHNLSMKKPEFFIEADDDGKIKDFSFTLHNFSIAGLADVEKIVFLGSRVYGQYGNWDAPYFKSLIEISNIKLNGLLDYPLTQTIHKIYVNSTIIGKIDFKENIQTSLHDWSAKNGHIEIDDFNVNWSPLLLVGKGDLYLNENFTPILQLNTTSKALDVLIDDLEKLHWLDSKGVFVAKILLSRKSYKSEEDDEHLTVTTPIAIRDDALLVEKISVKKFD